MVPLAACGVTRGDQSSDLLMIIPNAAGGGYDQTGREAVKVMEGADITGGSFTVDNIEGAGGNNAMSNLMADAGDERTLMTVGLGRGERVVQRGSGHRHLRDHRARGAGPDRD